MASDDDKLAPERMGIERTTRTVRVAETMPKFGHKRTRVKVSKVTLPRVRTLEKPDDG